MPYQDCKKKLHTEKASKNNQGNLTNLLCEFDVELPESMRAISDCLQSTPIQRLSSSTISSIAPPHIKREDTTQKNNQKNRGHSRQHIPKTNTRKPQQQED
ncbi:hypothetical protein ElyMa_005971800 [Elysia marginata]|uniref:Uncharacterized protein n=1 Tax=Elysia marginata TaxID=1093978 RepID=A0AAV4GCA3_9GAST|nr:hypothetical protein ElyMa_005971800 [Elysia marginata]